MEGLASTVMFGAFDRHNFGDLLFPHIAAALRGNENLLFAGLAGRDLRRHGGHRIQSLAQLAARDGDRPAHFIHTGGEILTCDAWEAAVMLLPPAQARPIIARLAGKPQQALAWAHGQLGLSERAPYALRRELFPGTVRVMYNAVGGVDLDKRDPALRAEVLAKLKAADAVGVRDNRTHALLHAAGIAARLMPDPAVMTAELFGARIDRCAPQGEVVQVMKAFPQGYIAVQFSADFGDDATLAAIAGQLDRCSASSGLGVAFFRAGAAPWHDELPCYRRIASRMLAPSLIFTSLHLWDICALIARASAYAGSSLHGRIVAMAFALPRVNIRLPAQTGHVTKQDAFAATWDTELPGVVEVEQIAQALGHALAAQREPLRQLARDLALRYRQGFDALCA